MVILERTSPIGIHDSWFTLLHPRSDSSCFCLALAFINPGDRLGVMKPEVEQKGLATSSKLYLQPVRTPPIRRNF